MSPDMHEGVQHDRLNRQIAIEMFLTVRKRPHTHTHTGVTVTLNVRRRVGLLHLSALGSPESSMKKPSRERTSQSQFKSVTAFDTMDNSK